MKRCSKCQFMKGACTNPDSSCWGAKLQQSHLVNLRVDAKLELLSFDNVANICKLEKEREIAFQKIFA